MATTNLMRPLTVCITADLVPHSGVAVKVGEQQLAVFYMPDESPQIYVMDNYDPIGRANVMSRGILGDIKGELVVAAPLYKQHFRLCTGVCVEDEGVSVAVFKSAIIDDSVVVWL
ncbi:MAG: nitrite reductase (NADH) small subunit [Sulfitobacter sp.]|jgi:nitrite reductase (NADH) small subunit